MVRDLDGECFDCGFAKISRKSVPKVSKNKSVIPGERIFVDISSVSAKSFGGNNFWVLVVDEYTGKKWAGFVRIKDMIGECVYTIIQGEKKLLANLRYVR